MMIKFSCWGCWKSVFIMTCSRESLKNQFFKNIFNLISLNERRGYFHLVCLCEKNAVLFYFFHKIILSFHKRHFYCHMVLFLDDEKLTSHSLIFCHHHELRFVYVWSCLKDNFGLVQFIKTCRSSYNLGLQ